MQKQQRIEPKQQQKMISKQYPLKKKKSKRDWQLRNQEWTETEEMKKSAEMRIVQWDRIEKKRYAIFLAQNKHLFQLSLKQRKKQSVHRQVSKFIRTRSPCQCRTHHQKVMKKYGSVDGIIANMRELILEGCAEKINQEEGLYVKMEEYIQNQNDELSLVNELGQVKEEYIEEQKIYSGDSKQVVKEEHLQKEEQNEEPKIQKQQLNHQKQAKANLESSVKEEEQPEPVKADKPSSQIHELWYTALLGFWEFVRQKTPDEPKQQEQ